MNGNTQADWAITQADRAKYMQMFSALDKNKKGYLTGSKIFVWSRFCYAPCLVSFRFSYYEIKQSHQMRD